MFYLCLTTGNKRFCYEAKILIKQKAVVGIEKCTGTFLLLIIIDICFNTFFKYFSTKGMVTVYSHQLPQNRT